MIRKAGHIFLSFILVLTTSGVTIREHYCGSNLVSVNIFSEPDKCCDNSDCCHNETVSFKLNTDIINVSPVYIFEPVYSSVSLVAEAIFNNNTILSPFLTLSFIRSSDIPPPAIMAFLSKLGAFLL